MKIVGIDLAGSKKQATGFCFMDENLNCETFVLHSDKEIIEETLKRNPDIISIDAPLSLPKGRKSLEQKGPPHFRACDKELLKMRIKFFPITLGPMRSLTKRGIKLKKFFEEKGYKVIESFPGAAQDLLGIPRKQKGKEKLKKALIKLGIKKGIEKEKITDHELDAITCALVGKFYLEKNYIALGDKKEGLIILPKKV
ncbi:MAG: DUF429 domain-containing protein [Candidatus Aenigmatarchaeota archaeon]